MNLTCIFIGGLMKIDREGDFWYKKSENPKNKDERIFNVIYFNDSFASRYFKSEFKSIVSYTSGVMSGINFILNSES